MVHALRVDRVTTTGSSVALRLMRSVEQNRKLDFEDWTVTIHPVFKGPAATSGPSRRAGDVAGSFVPTLVAYAGSTASDSLESFAQELSRTLMEDSRLSAVDVFVEAHLWKRVTIHGKPHPSAYMKGSDERQTVQLRRDHNGVALRSGFAHMTLARSFAFDFPIPPTAASAAIDPPLAFLRLSADWTYASDALAAGLSFSTQRQQIREHLIATFADLASLTLPGALQQLAQAVLGSSQALAEISVRAPDAGSLEASLAASDHQALTEINLRRS